MELYGFSNFLQHRFTCARVSPTPGRARHVGCEVVWGSLNDDGVLHGSAHSSSPACFIMLFQVPARQVISWLARNGHTARFHRVLELAMASSSMNESPSVLLYQLHGLSNFVHRWSALLQNPAAPDSPRSLHPAVETRSAARATGPRDGPSSPRRARHRPPVVPRRRTDRG